jgi:YVTN family beta-propeller protein
VRIGLLVPLIVLLASTMSIHPQADLTGPLPGPSAVVYVPYAAKGYPSAPGEDCWDLIKNGGFETTGHWEIPITAHTAGYSTVQAYGGNRSMRVGIVRPINNVKSWSSARQLVTIPADATSATLRFWLWPKSGEVTTLASPIPSPARPLARTVEEAILSSDAQYVLVLNQAGTRIDTLLRQKRDDRQWTYHEIDLSDWAGETIKLHFGVFNDGVHGVTAMYVDDVSLEVCTGGAPPGDCYPKLDDTVAVKDAPHGVAVNSAADRIYVANHKGDSLTVIDSTTYTRIRTTAVGDGPNGVAYNPTNNRVYVALRNSNRVKVLRANGSEVVKTIVVGSQPNGVAVNRVTNKIFVANFGSGTVSKIDGGTNTVRKTIPVGSQPSMIAVNPNTNKAYVTLHGDGRVAVIDGAGNVKSVDIYSAGPYGIAVDRVRNLVYVATIDTFRIVVVDGNTDTFLGWAEIRRMPGEEPVPLRMIAVNPNIGTSGHIFATTAGVDGGWNKFLLLPKGWNEYFARAHALDLNEPREGIAFEPSTDRVFVTSRGDDLVAAYLDGEPVCATNFVMSSGYQVTVCVADPDGTCRETFYR